VCGGRISYAVAIWSFEYQVAKVITEPPKFSSYGVYIHAFLLPSPLGIIVNTYEFSSCPSRDVELCGADQVSTYRRDESMPLYTRRVQRAHGDDGEWHVAGSE